MAKLSILAGATSVSVNVFIQDSSSTTGAGLTALVFNTSGLTAYYTFAGANATATVIALATLAAVNSAYSSGGFKEIDATNMPGVYRLDIPNAALAAAKGRSVLILMKGAANMAPLALEIALTGVDNQDAAAFGMSRLDAAITTRMATFTLPTNFSLFSIDANGRIDVIKVNGTSQTARDLGAQLDATVSSRMATFTLPTNFSSLVIDVSGRVDVSKVSGTAQTARDLGAQLDATVSSRMATFTLPTNFSTLSIDISGRIDLGKWIGSAPAALSASGYVQGIIQRWLTDNAAGTPNALVSGDLSALMHAVTAAVLTAAAFAANAIDANALAASAANEIRDTILTDATPFPGARIDAAISTRSTLTQAQILSDSIPFPGARIDAAISSRSTLTQAQVLSDATPFAGANVDAAVSSRAPAATALSNAVWTNAKAAQVDANISSRATPTQIVSDGVAFLGANVDTTISSRAPAATALSTANWTNARAVLIDNLGILKIKKNTALNNFAFLMVQSADHISPATGLTVAVQRSIDGAAFANATATPAIEIGNGVYKINLSAADLNGDIIVLKMTATGADQRTIVIATEP